MSQFDIVVIGTSAGGIAALEKLLTALDADVVVPIVIVQHLSADSGDSILNLLKKYSKIPLDEPIDKEKVTENHIYLASPDYHLMIEQERTFSLSLDPKVNYCRPSIDVLFETAAEVYMERTLGVVLTGANKDGSNGAAAIKRFSGTVVVQKPDEAVMPVMPNGVIEREAADYILTLEEISCMLNRVLKE